MAFNETAFNAVFTSFIDEPDYGPPTKNFKVFWKAYKAKEKLTLEQIDKELEDILEPIPPGLNTAVFDLLVFNSKPAAIAQVEATEIEMRDPPRGKARTEKIMEMARTAKTFEELENIMPYKANESADYKDYYRHLYDKLSLEYYYHSERQRKEEEHIEKYGIIGTKNHYKIVKGRSFNELEKNVNEYLEKGYNVSGGVLLDKIEYSQAVFRKGIEIEFIEWSPDEDK